MKSAGKLYVDTLKYPPKFGFFPIVDKGWTDEIEPPFRRGKCLVFRLPFFTKGLIVGLWGAPTGRTETQALSEALGARQVDLSVVSDINDPVWVCNLGDPVWEGSGATEI